MVGCVGCVRHTAKETAKVPPALSARCPARVSACQLEGNRSSPEVLQKDPGGQGVGWGLPSGQKEPAGHLPPVAVAGQRQLSRSKGRAVHAADTQNRPEAGPVGRAEHWGRRAGRVLGVKGQAPPAGHCARG